MYRIRHRHVNMINNIAEGHCGILPKLVSPVRAALAAAIRRSVKALQCHRQHTETHTRVHANVPVVTRALQRRVRRACWQDNHVSGRDVNLGALARLDLPDEKRRRAAKDTIALVAVRVEVTDVDVSPCSLGPSQFS